MNKKSKRILKVLVVSTLGVLTSLVLLFFWYGRTPTTRLVDTTGTELKTVSASNSAKDGNPASIFDEPRRLMHKSEFANAKKALLKILDDADRDGECCILLCRVCRELKQLEEAADYGLKAVTLLPDDHMAHLEYAKAIGAQLAESMRSISGMFGAMAKLGTFKKELQRVIELNPQDTEARSMLVFTNMAPAPIGSIDRAIAICHEIEKYDPVSAKQLLAMCYMRKKETDRAIQLLHNGIEQYPDENSIHVTLADIYAENKQFRLADASYETAREIKTNVHYYRSLYGQARMRIRNEFEPERAIELLDEFIAADPKGENLQSVAHALWRKGIALEQLERVDDARMAYATALERDPDLKLAADALTKLSK